MPRYLIGFPVYNAFFETDEMSFKVADVTFMSMVSLSKEIPYLNEEKSHFKENQIFAIVTICRALPNAKEQAYDRCCFATDIFKICSDLYHSNFFNPKKWQFDVNKDFITYGESDCYCKELDSINLENFHVDYKRNRFPAYINSDVLSSVNKWNIKDFESLYNIVYSPEAKNIHKVLKRGCRIYSQSFSINNIYERIVWLCTVLDTLATCERENKVGQLKNYLPALVLKSDRLSEALGCFIRDIYDLRSAYIHNAEENPISEKDVDKLEKIVYRLILQLVRKSKEYKSIKEIFKNIDKGLFVPNNDNVQDIYVPKGIMT
jgi:hypothetical protein